MRLDYKLARYEGKCFIELDMVRGGCFSLNYLFISLFSLFASSESRLFNISYCSRAESLSFKET